MDQPLLCVKEAAQLLQVSKWMIYRWIDEGRLHATKIGGGSLRIFRRSVTDLVDGNRPDPRSHESVSKLKVVPLAGRRTPKWSLNRDGS
ncbi:MAG: helix-turn-helix domain-containing protein [Nitrospira sp.]|nr:helix-turn-helix domain-containing protein [Nitrospira sp.]